MQHLRLNTEMLDPLIDAHYGREQFFNLCGISRFSGYRYRSGKINPPIEFLIKIKEVLQLKCCVESLVVPCEKVITVVSDGQS